MVEKVIINLICVLNSIKVTVIINELFLTALKAAKILETDVRADCFILIEFFTSFLVKRILIYSRKCIKSLWNINLGDRSNKIKVEDTTQKVKRCIESSNSWQNHWKCKDISSWLSSMSMKLENKNSDSFRLFDAFKIVIS